MFSGCWIHVNVIESSGSGEEKEKKDTSEICEEKDALEKRGKGVEKRKKEICHRYFGNLKFPV